MAREILSGQYEYTSTENDIGKYNTNKEEYGASYSPIIYSGAAYLSYQLSVTFIEDENFRKKISDNLEKYTKIAGISDSLQAFGKSLDSKIDGKLRDYLIEHNYSKRKDPLNYQTHGFIDRIYRSVENTALLLEENSPGKIVRTFNLSDILDPFYSKLRNKTYTVSGNYVQKNISYFSQIEEGENFNRKIKTRDLQVGIGWDDGNLYGLKFNGAKKVIDYQDIIATNVIATKAAKNIDNSENISKNQIVKSFFQEAGYGKDDFNNLLINSKDENYLTFLSGDNKTKLYSNLGKAGMLNYLETGFKTFDKPFSFLEEVFGNDGLFKTYIGKKIVNSLRFNFGPGEKIERNNESEIVYDKNLKDSILSTGKRTILKGGAIYAGYNLIDYGLRSAFGEENDIDGIASKAYQNASVLYAEVISDHFQEYKKRQEESAPGSSLLGIGGIMLGASFMGATIGYGRFLGDSAIRGIEKATEVKEQKPIGLMNPVREFADNYGLGNSKIISSAIDRIDGLLSSSGYAGRYTKIGALVSGIISLPLLPGALIGEDSDTLRDIYSGEKEVAVRSSRYWFMGGSNYHGEEIKYFKKHITVDRIKDAETNLIYRDKETKDSLNPLFNPFSYAEDPYRLERMNDKDMPFPVWGMDVSYGTFFGKVINILGEIVKPSVINPRHIELLTREGDEESSRLFNSGVYQASYKVSKEEAELIRSGDMMPILTPNSGTVGYNLSPALEGLFDFAGVKGWVTGFFLPPEGYKARELERSGSYTNLKRKIEDAQLGDIGGLGEFQRRIINTNASSRVDTYNTIKNSQPSWMPSTSSNYYVDFSTGNPYGKIQHGYMRLPGRGYETFNEDLKGVDPEDYPLIHKFKILSDAAIGSKNYYQHKAMMDKRILDGSATDFEVKEYNKIIEQTTQRLKGKDFDEEKSFYDLYTENGGFFAVSGSAWRKLNEIVSGPIEDLTPLRMASKFAHYRTATEDYKRNVLYGSDMAIWTRPYDHFLGAAINRTRAAIGGDFIPEDVDKRRAIDEYFDKLEFLKYRKIEREALKEGDTKKAGIARGFYEKTATGILSTGLSNDMELSSIKSVVSAKTKPYVSSFINEKDPEKRREIAEMLSPEERKIISAAWMNIDEYSLIEDEEEKRQWRESKRREGKGLLEEIEEDAINFVSDSLGMPEEDFSGWDERINLDDVKLRFLKVVGEDPKDFNFFENSEKELFRNNKVMTDESIIAKAKAIDYLLQKYKNRDYIEFETRRRINLEGLHSGGIYIGDGNGSIEFAA